MNFYIHIIWKEKWTLKIFLKNINLGKERLSEVYSYFNLKWQMRNWTKRSNKSMIKTTDILIDILNAANSPAIQAISPKTTVPNSWWNCNRSV